MNRILKVLMDEYLSEVDDNFTETRTVDILKFGVYLVTVIFIFLVYLNLLLSDFNIFLRKTRNLVGMLPFHFLLKNNQLVRKLVQKIS